MKPTLAIVATAILLATASAAFVEYSERNLRNYFSAAVPISCPQMTAELHLENTFAGVRFKRRNDQVANVAQFEQIFNPRAFCPMPGNFFSIRIHGVGVYYCMAGYFDVKVDEHEGDMKTISLFVSFFESANNGFVFQVPLLRKPVQEMSGEEDWAEDLHLVLGNEGSLPLSITDIRKQIRSPRRMVVDMWFLKELLLHGISRSVTPDYISDARRGMPIFITRPLLVDVNYLTALQRLVSRLNGAVI